MAFTPIDSADQLVPECSTIPQVKEVLEQVYGELEHVLTSATNEEDTPILQGCLPLLMNQVRAETLIQLIGQKKYERLRALYQQGSILNLWYSAELKHILETMAAAQIRMMLLKGADVAASLYPLPELRPFQDIDLMVQPKDVSATITILEKAGYHYHQEYRFEAVSKQRAAFVYVKEVSAGYLAFEIHTSPHANEMGVSFDAAQMWERARPITVAGISAYGMGLEDLLLYLCWHYRSHLFSRLIWLYDITLLLLYNADQIDWTLIRRLASEQGLAATVHYIMRCSHLAFHIPIPEGAGKLCKPPAFIQKLISGLIGDDLTSLLRKTAERERKLLYYLMVDDMKTLCLVGWHTVFPSPIGLMSRYMEHSCLPLHLFWLYYPLHPLLAVRTYFRSFSNKRRLLGKRRL